MKVLNLLNAIVLEIQKNKDKYYFFLDAGYPNSHSFIDGLDHLSGVDIGFEGEFNLNLSHSKVAEQSLGPLSRIFGIQLSGILGIDFFHKFNNISIDFNSRSLKFNVDKFECDFESSLLNINPFMISVTVENQAGSCLVDTGAFQCMTFSSFAENKPRSNGWKFPSAFGIMEIDYFSSVNFSINDNAFTDFIFGKANNLPPLPFSYVLGLNYLSNYTTLFDMENKLLKFKKSELSHKLNSKPTFTLGIQIEIIHNDIIVSNLLPTSVSGINIGDKITIPGLDMTNPEVVNTIYNKIIFLESNNDVELVCNGKNTMFTPNPLFI